MHKRSYIAASIVALISFTSLSPSSKKSKEKSESRTQQDFQQSSFHSLDNPFDYFAEATPQVADSTRSKSNKKNDKKKPRTPARAEIDFKALLADAASVHGSFVSPSQRNADGDKRAQAAQGDEELSDATIEQAFNDMLKGAEWSKERETQFNELRKKIKQGIVQEVRTAFKPFQEKTFSEIELTLIWPPVRDRCGDKTGIAEFFWDNVFASADYLTKKALFVRDLGVLECDTTTSLPVVKFLVERVNPEEDGELNRFYEKLITNSALLSELPSLFEKKWIHFERSELEKKLRAAAKHSKKSNEFNVLYDYLGKPHNSRIDSTSKSLFQVVLDSKNYGRIAQLRRDGASIVDAAEYIKNAIAEQDQKMLEAVTECPAGGDKVLAECLPQLLVEAAKCGNKDAVKLFLDRGATIDKSSDTEKPAENILIGIVVASACKKSNTTSKEKQPDYVGVLNVLLTKGGFAVENEDGLPWWVELEKVCGDTLLQACPDLLTASNGYGRTPLTSALMSNKLETVQKVLALGVSLTISHTDAAWCYVVEHAHELSPEVVKCVYEHVNLAKNSSKVDAAFKAAVKAKNVNAVRSYLAQQDTLGLLDSLIQNEFSNLKSQKNLNPCKKILEEHLKKPQSSKPLSSSSDRERKREIEQAEIDTKKSRASATSTTTGDAGEQSAAQSQRAEEQQASPLARAVKGGKLPQVKQLLRDGAAVTGDVVELALDNAPMLKIILPKVKGTPGFSLNKLLKDAVAGGKVNALEELIAQGADAYQCSEDGTLIMTAATAPCSDSKRKKMIEILKRRIDINACDKNGLPWWLAPGKEAERKLLVECGASLDAYNKQGETLLVTAAAQGNLERVTQLLEEGASVDRGAKNNTTPLLAALKAGHSNVVTALLARGASVEKADGLLYVVENAQELPQEVVEQLYASVDAQKKQDVFKAAVASKNIKRVKACLAQQDALGISDVVIQDAAKSLLQKRQYAELKGLLEGYLYKKEQQAKQVAREQSVSEVDSIEDDRESIEGPSEEDDEIETKGKAFTAQVVHDVALIQESSDVMLQVALLDSLKEQTKNQSPVAGISSSQSSSVAVVVSSSVSAAQEQSPTSSVSSPKHQESLSDGESIEGPEEESAGSEFETKEKAFAAQIMHDVTLTAQESRDEMLQAALLDSFKEQAGNQSPVVVSSSQSSSTQVVVPSSVPVAQEQSATSSTSMSSSVVAPQQPFSKEQDLLNAARRGLWGLVGEILKDKTVNVNYTCPTTGQTPLIAAIVCNTARKDNTLEKRITNSVKKLLKRGADVDTGLPLIQAVKHNRIGAISVLSERAKLLGACDEQGNSPLHHAVLSGNPDAVAILLQSGATTHAWNLAGHTPLHIAARTVSPASARIADMLLRNGADSGMTDKLHRTALTVAASHDNWEFIEAVGRNADGLGVQINSGPTGAPVVVSLVGLLAHRLAEMTKMLGKHTK